jgi:hypothetical protein
MDGWKTQLDDELRADRCGTGIVAQATQKPLLYPPKQQPPCKLGISGRFRIPDQLPKTDGRSL